MAGELDEELARFTAAWRVSPAGMKYEADKAERLRQLMERRAKIPADELERLDREAMQKLEALASGNVRSMR